MSMQRNKSNRFADLERAHRVLSGHHIYVREIAPSGVCGSALHGGDERFGNDHGLRVTRHFDGRVAEEARQRHRGGRRPDDVADVDVNVENNPRSSECTRDGHSNSAVNIPFSNCFGSRRTVHPSVLPGLREDVVDERPDTVEIVREVTRRQIDITGRAARTRREVRHL